jgi:hypothetical protein
LHLKQNYTQTASRAGRTSSDFANRARSATGGSSLHGLDAATRSQKETMKTGGRYELG